MFSLFTDASHNFLDSGYTVLAGVILDDSNTPIAEFSVRSEATSNFEGLAIAHGLHLAKDMGISHLRCFTDCFTSAKLEPSKLDPIASQFEFVSVNYIPRRYNQYANALSRVFVNARFRSDGDFKKAYHGVNRAKGSFYRQLKELFRNHTRYEKNLDYKRAYAKFNCIMNELKMVSDGTKNIDIPKLEQLLFMVQTLFEEHKFDNACSFDELLTSREVHNISNVV